MFWCSPYHHYTLLSAATKYSAHNISSVLCIIRITVHHASPFRPPRDFQTSIYRPHLQLPKKTFVQLHSFSLSFSFSSSPFSTSFSPFFPLCPCGNTGPHQDPIPLRVLPSIRLVETGLAGPKRNPHSVSYHWLSLIFSFLSLLSLSSSSFLFPVVFFFFPFLRSFLRFKCCSVPRTETFPTRGTSCLCLCLPVPRLINWLYSWPGCS